MIPQRRLFNKEVNIYNSSLHRYLYSTKNLHTLFMSDDGIYIVWCRANLQEAADQILPELLSLREVPLFQDDPETDRGR